MHKLCTNHIHCRGDEHVDTACLYFSSSAGLPHDFERPAYIRRSTEIYGDLSIQVYLQPLDAGIDTVLGFLLPLLEEARHEDPRQHALAAVGLHDLHHVLDGVLDVIQQDACCLAVLSVRLCMQITKTRDARPGDEGGE